MVARCISFQEVPIFNQCVIVFECHLKCEEIKNIKMAVYLFIYIRMGFLKLTLPTYHFVTKESVYVPIIKTMAARY